MQRLVKNTPVQVPIDEPNLHWDRPAFVFTCDTHTLSDIRGGNEKKIISPQMTPLPRIDVSYAVSVHDA